MTSDPQIGNRVITCLRVDTGCLRDDQRIDQRFESRSIMFLEHIATRSRHTLAMAFLSTTLVWRALQAMSPRRLMVN
jgi:hypothetical protein